MIEVAGGGVEWIRPLATFTLCNLLKQSIPEEYLVLLE
jgi:hypothetical protein